LQVLEKLPEWNLADIAKVKQNLPELRGTWQKKFI
jgi:hypothetical protein